MQLLFMLIHNAISNRTLNTTCSGMSQKKERMSESAPLEIIALFIVMRIRENALLGTIVLSVFVYSNLIIQVYRDLFTLYL